MGDPVGNIEPFKKGEPWSGGPEIADILVGHPTAQLACVPSERGITEKTAGIEVQIQLGIGGKFARG